MLFCNVNQMFALKLSLNLVSEKSKTLLKKQRLFSMIARAMAIRSIPTFFLSPIGIISGDSISSVHKLQSEIYFIHICSFI